MNLWRKITGPKVKRASKKTTTMWMMRMIPSLNLTTEETRPETEELLHKKMPMILRATMVMNRCNKSKIFQRALRK